jgi:hypothetical protein
MVDNILFCTFEHENSTMVMNRSGLCKPDSLATI